ncbi:hypothetical protein [Psychromonas sp. Urea-02u-13]|uniref:hypothetical protein n=1 Tax=Psychromonas sp. Urea-02u-13 TaxID=2058326 RepID=UPI000C32E7A6|nr:hypothetical protein [Psychromonas sp. Urea-02u-13]PKG39733.1 hypothetical protein CXF74_06665 [Psychromonas sp. Urea-02u-13]
MIFRSFQKCAYILICALFISSCVSISPEEFKSANFGEKPINYEYDIKSLMSRMLKDPQSALYSFGEPKKGMTQDGWAVGGRKYFGYIVQASINSKNSFGGYTGAKRYYFLFSEGNVMEVTSMINSGMGNILE